LRSYFLGLFSGSSIILYKKFEKIKSSSSGKSIGTKNVFNPVKKGFDLKNTPGYIEYADV